MQQPKQRDRPHNGPGQGNHAADEERIADIFAAADSVELTKSVWAKIHGLASLLVEGQFSEGVQAAQAQEQTIRFHLERMLTALAPIGVGMV